MKLAEVVSQQITILCGNLASGKGHYAKAHFPDATVIGVSSVVKQLTNLKTRSELSQTAELDYDIARELIDKIECSSNQKVVIDGIRQPTILKALISHFGDQIKNIIWLDVPEHKRRAHFDNREAKKDDIPFDQAVQLDKDLGIDDVETYIRKHGRVIRY